MDAIAPISPAGTLLWYEPPRLDGCRPKHTKKMVSLGVV